ncbi:zinc transporter ZupT [Ornithinimicrobium humiphilum]|uniref:ZIP family zinc transporter n=1 Tax=Ornithinimicrobium humiphilum TaxID=125288 RepID=A0A543KK67_9MICO|nr:zinc transporter ZupT [Ornithinimicrobium humiphilum]TQM95458.1 ZIP family zinc transporter [Ornithinimicrobium humiphilum]
MTLAFVVALLAGLSTVVGGWLGTQRQLLRRDALAASLAFAAGLMITISVVEIAPVAVRSLAEVVGQRGALVWVGGALLLGALVVLGIDRAIPHDVNLADLEGEDAAAVDGRLLRSGILLAGVVTLHNLPEGLATFVATLQQPTGGIALAVAIAIHNVPEGLAVAAPIYAATGSRARALVWATLSGLAEPFGAIVGFLLLQTLLPEEWVVLSLALVAGMMLAVSFLELLPAARRYETHYSQSLVGFFLGAVVMALSLVLLAAPTS